MIYPPASMQSNNSNHEEHNISPAGFMSPLPLIRSTLLGPTCAFAEKYPEFFTSSATVDARVQAVYTMRKIKKEFRLWLYSFGFGRRGVRFRTGHFGGSMVGFFRQFCSCQHYFLLGRQC